MYRICTAVLTGVVIVLAAQSSQAMRRIDSLPPAPGKGLPSRAGVGPMQPVAPLTAAQQATIGRRIRTAMSGLDRVHVVGSKPAPVPPQALDALAEWREHAAKDVEMWWDPDTRTPFFIKGTCGLEIAARQTVRPLQTPEAASARHPAPVNTPCTGMRCDVSLHA
jgi:hypothetical protein